MLATTKYKTKNFASKNEKKLETKTKLKFKMFLKKLNNNLKQKSLTMMKALSKTESLQECPKCTSSTVSSVSTGWAKKPDLFAR